MSKSCLNMFEPYLDVCSFLLPHSTARSSPWELLEHGDTPDPSGPAWAAPCCRLWRLDAAASPSPSLLRGCLVGTWLVLPILRQNFFWLLGACAVAGVVSRERDSACSQLHQRSFRAVDPQRRFGFGGVVFFQPQVHAAGRQQPIGSGVYSQRRLRCRQLEQPLGASDVFQRGGLPRGAISKRWHVGIVHSNESGKKETVATPCGISCWRTVTQHLHLAGEWTSFAVFLLCCLEIFLVVGSLWKRWHVHACSCTFPIYMFMLFWRIHAFDSAHLRYPEPAYAQVIVVVGEHSQTWSTRVCFDWAEFQDCFSNCCRMHCVSMMFRGIPIFKFLRFMPLAVLFLVPFCLVMIYWHILFHFLFISFEFWWMSFCSFDFYILLSSLIVFCVKEFSLIFEWNINFYWGSWFPFESQLKYIEISFFIIFDSRLNSEPIQTNWDIIQTSFRHHSDIIETWSSHSIVRAKFSTVCTFHRQAEWKFINHNVFAT